MTDIFAIGNALVDYEFLLTDAQLARTRLTKGNMTLAQSEQQQALIKYLTANRLKMVKKSGGGSAANTAFAIACLGGSPFYGCRVGDDDLGEFYLHDLQQARVATAKKSKAEGITGTCLVLITEDGERTMQTHLGTSAELSLQDIEDTSLCDSTLLYIEGYLATSATAVDAITLLRDKARQHGVKVALSFADPAMVKFAKEGLTQIIGSGVDMIFCNHEEACLFTDTSTIKSAATALLKHAELVVITNGSEPSLIATNKEKITVDTPQVVEVLDTNGAGDNFAGAFLYAYSQQYTLPECGQLAAAVSAQVVQVLGSRLDKQGYQDVLTRVLTN